MEKKRILYVSQEIVPYLPETEMAKTALDLPKHMNEKGHEVRVFMPRFGVINERRHQLHEVIRLSGMNMIINDMDQPLIIKVASVPQARMQVYFIDNDEYFKRKALFQDKDKKFFEDNHERTLFFCRGVIETVKKLGWSPDIIHCHGWMTAFLPLYIKKFHSDDPLFEGSKLVFSAYNTPFRDEKLGEEMLENLKFDGLKDEELKLFEGSTVQDLNKTGITYSDAVVKTASLEEELGSFADKAASPALEMNEEDGTSPDAVEKFYEEVVMEESVV